LSIARKEKRGFRGAGTGAEMVRHEFRDVRSRLLSCA
jgi:hypothetical protein